MAAIVSGLCATFLKSEELIAASTADDSERDPVRRVPDKRKARRSSGRAFRDGAIKSEVVPVSGTEWRLG